VSAWVQFSLIVADAQVEAAEARLLDAGAVSVTLGEGGEDEILEPGPGCTPLWQQVRVTGLFPAELPESSILASLDEFADSRLWRRKILEDRAWEREWLQYFKATVFADRLLICPCDERPVESPGQVVLRLDPGLAFGTGTHPTTALCLNWLAANVSDGDLVIDYGCGSGILAVAALLLGMRRAHAVDIDPQALAATRENASRNGLEATRLSTFLPADSPDEAAQLLVANILAEPLIALAPTLLALLRPGATLVLSGLLCSQQDAVLAAYRKQLLVEDTQTRDDWVCLILRAPEPGQ
jgi:ribosomal protein L11 methyltransferase